MLGRTEMRTRDRVYCQTIRSVRDVDISRDDRARIATCRLRTPTDRQTDRLTENYSIDYKFVNIHFIYAFTSICIIIFLKKSTLLAICFNFVPDSIQLS